LTIVKSINSKIYSQ